MRAINLQEIHQVLLSLAKEFHRICYKHHIPYYMLGGTMLGAIRHKGFIPWDDDMDFGIPREYFSTFRDVCRAELSQHYKFIDYDNSNYAVLGIAKMTDTRTELNELFSVETNEKIGVYIDIFPLDTTNDKTSIFSYNKRMRNYFKLQKLLCVNPNDRTFTKKMLSKVIRYILPIKNNTIPKYIENSCLKRGKRKNHNMIFNIYGAWGMKELIPNIYFGTPQLYDFEDTKLYGVQNFDLYLKKLYGNYMQLPPEEKRHIHISNVYCKE